MGTQPTLKGRLLIHSCGKVTSNYHLYVQAAFGETSLPPPPPPPPSAPWLPQHAGVTAVHPHPYAHHIIPTLTLLLLLLLCRASQLESSSGQRLVPSRLQGCSDDCIGKEHFVIEESQFLPGCHHTSQVHSRCHFSQDDVVINHVDVD